MNLILLEAAEISPDGRVTLTDIRAEHVRRVLRAQPGERLRVGVRDGSRGQARIETISPEGVALQVLAETLAPAPEPVADLLLALPRPKVMKRLWAQLAALGVGRIFLVNAERVERQYFDTHVLQPAVYRPLLVEGLQQACLTRLPQVGIHKRLKVFLEDELPAAAPAGARMLCDVGGHPHAADLPAAAWRERPLAAVGPEGGWTDHERELFRAHGFKPVTLGARVLRADTACVAFLAVVGEMRR